MQMFNDRVMVTKDPKSSTSKGGIILPGEEKKGTALWGTVVAVGPGFPVVGSATERRKIRCTPGDRVMFSSFSGTEVKLPDRPYKAVNERGEEVTDDVYVILRDDDIYFVK